MQIKFFTFLKRWFKVFAIPENKEFLKTKLSEFAISFLIHFALNF